MEGRRTGSSLAASVQPIACMVWLATWARLSPVMMAPQPRAFATRLATIIITRRMMTVKYSSLQPRLISS